MPGAFRVLRPGRGSASAHFFGEVFREVGHRLVVLLVFVFLVGLLLRVALG